MNHSISTHWHRSAVRDVVNIAKSRNEVVAKQIILQTPLDGGRLEPLPNLLQPLSKVPFPAIGQCGNLQSAIE
jgi:hypothetical protein